MAAPRRILRRFLADRSANFAVFAGLATIPLILALGGAIDLDMAARGKARVQDAVDAASLAAAREFIVNADDEAVLAFAKPYFEANTIPLDPGSTELFYDGVVQEGTQRSLRMHATYDYQPHFLNILSLLGDGGVGDPIEMRLESEVVLRNDTIEMAMVLDNSGSMRYRPESDTNGSVGNRRIDALHVAANDLVDTLFDLRESMGIADSIKIGIVPFSTSVNVGKRFAGEGWVDADGRSPIHHENFDWSTWRSAQPVTETIDGGSVTRWKLNEQWLTRQWMFENVTATSSNTVNVSSCAPKGGSGTCAWTDAMVSGARVWTLKRNGTTVCTSATDAACWPTTTRAQSGSKLLGSWKGCFEGRPDGLAASDAVPDQTKPKTLFVPYFSPDEFTGQSLMLNSFLREKDSVDTSSVPSRLRGLRDSRKYVEGPQIDSTTASANAGCIPTELLPLSATRQTIKDKIAEMVPEGSTNIPEGIAWGWRVLSSTVPFTEGRPSGAEQNIKVLVIMTDGENTYFPQYSNGTAVTVSDPVRSIYGAFGYAKIWNAAGTSSSNGRVFAGTTRTSYDPATYTKAMNDNMASLCEAIKRDGQTTTPQGETRDGILVATIAFATGEPSGRTGDAANVADRLKACASYSLVDPTRKLFSYAGNATELKAAFEELVLEVSSLRIAH